MNAKNNIKEKQNHRIYALITSAIPGIAGSIANQAINIYLSSLEEERVNSLIKKIERDIEKFSIHVDKTYIKSEKFSVIFETTYKATVNAKSQEKLDQIKNIFLFGLSEKNYNDTIEFFNIINNLEYTHILVLKRCWEQLLTARKIGSPTTPNVTLDGLTDFFRDIPKRVLERTSNHLIGLGLLENPTIGKYGSSNGIYTLTNYGVFFCEEIIEKR